MKNYFKLLPITLASVLLLMPAKSDAGRVDISVGAGGDFFVPSTAVAVVGDTIVWTWVSGIHNVVSTSVPPGASPFTSPLTGQVGFQFKYIVEVDGTYNYHCQVHFGMEGTILVEPSSVTPWNNEIPTSFDLQQNFPNPFNPVTQINFSIPVNSNVLLTVYNIAGQEVTRLVNDELTAGNYNVNFDAASLTSGVYFYRIKAGDYSQTRKMILAK